MAGTVSFITTTISEFAIFNIPKITTTRKVITDYLISNAAANIIETSNAIITTEPTIFTIQKIITTTSDASTKIQIKTTSTYFIETFKTEMLLSGTTRLDEYDFSVSTMIYVPSFFTTTHINTITTTTESTAFVTTEITETTTKAKITFGVSHSIETSTKILTLNTTNLHAASHIINTSTKTLNLDITQLYENYMIEITSAASHLIETYTKISTLDATKLHAVSHLINTSTKTLTLDTTKLYENYRIAITKSINKTTTKSSAKIIETQNIYFEYLSPRICAPDMTIKIVEDKTTSSRRNVFIKVGTTGKIHCLPYDKQSAEFTSMKWSNILPNKNNNSFLIIQDANLEDSKEHICHAKGKNLNKINIINLIVFMIPVVTSSFEFSVRGKCGHKADIDHGELKEIQRYLCVGECNIVSMHNCNQVTDHGSNKTHMIRVIKFPLIKQQCDIRSQFDAMVKELDEANLIYTVTSKAGERNLVVESILRNREISLCCELGHSLLRNMCVPCMPGTYNGKLCGQQCEPCLNNTYSDTPGLHECKLCNKKFVNSTHCMAIANNNWLFKWLILTWIFLILFILLLILLLKLCKKQKRMGQNQNISNGKSVHFINKNKHNKMSAAGYKYKKRGEYNFQNLKKNGILDEIDDNLTLPLLHSQIIEDYGHFQNENFHNKLNNLYQHNTFNGNTSYPLFSDSEITTTYNPGEINCSYNSSQTQSLQAQKRKDLMSSKSNKAKINNTNFQKQNDERREPQYQQCVGYKSSFSESEKSKCCYSKIKMSNKYDNAIAEQLQNNTSQKNSSKNRASRQDLIRRVADSTDEDLVHEERSKCKQKDYTDENYKDLNEDNGKS